ncbi:hypothetical protein [Microcella alkalica]|uniref:hypothetical protein n=1 Tax=Microcella alkalica TaxID=355930 RepID=UPI00145C8162|nr:hypothetical protein [Microcella alkalica]
MRLVEELLASCVEPSAYCDDTQEIVIGTPVSFWLPFVLAVVTVLLIGIVAARLVARRERRRADQAQDS